MENLGYSPDAFLFKLGGCCCFWFLFCRENTLMKGLRRALVVVALVTASVLSKLEGREAVRLMEVKLEVKDWKAGGWRKQGRGRGQGPDVT